MREPFRERRELLMAEPKQLCRERIPLIGLIRQEFSIPRRRSLRVLSP